MPNDTSPVLRKSANPRCKYAADGCDRDAVEVCMACQEAFCPDHASSIDPAFCSACLSPKEAEVKREPLVDDEGVTHVGARIVPIGSVYKTLAQRITEMSDEELENHINDIKKKIHDSEVALDKHRIDLSVSGIEVEEREAIRRKKLRGKTVAVIANGKSIDGDTEKTKKIQKTVGNLQSIAAAFGVTLDTPEKITKFAQMLANMAGKKTPPPPSGETK